MTARGLTQEPWTFTLWLVLVLLLVGGLAWYETLSGIWWLAFDVTPVAAWFGWLGWKAWWRR